MNNGGSLQHPVGDCNAGTEPNNLLFPFPLLG